MDYSRRNVEVDEGTHAIDRAWVASGFFDALGRPVTLGRDFDAADVEGERRAVIVNVAFVQNVLDGGSPLGRRLRYPTDGEDALWYEIVGVAPDLGMDPLNPSGGAGVYHPVAPGELGAPWLAVHVGPNAVSYLPRLRELIAEVDAAVVLELPSTLGDWGPGDDRLVMLLMAAGSMLLAAILLALAASSIYAIMAFTVAQRTREIGLRSALGARPTDIAATIARRAALQLGIGVLLGMPLAGRVYYLTQENPAAKGAAVVAAVVPATLVLLLLAAVACSAPLARALRIQPTEALKGEG
jgi:putative ABC transport system permease protein